MVVVFEAIFPGGHQMGFTFCKPRTVERETSTCKQLTTNYTQHSKQTVENYHTEEITELKADFP